LFQLPVYSQVYGEKPIREKQLDNRGIKPLVSAWNIEQFGIADCEFRILASLSLGIEHGAKDIEIKSKKAPSLFSRRNGAQSTYRSVSDCLLDGEWHPGSLLTYSPALH
jgi:hypothetical protein